MAAPHDKYPIFPTHQWDWQICDVGAQKRIELSHTYINRKPVHEPQLVSQGYIVQYYGHPVWAEAGQVYEPPARVSRLFSQNIHIVNDVLIFNQLYRKIWQAAVQVIWDASTLFPNIFPPCAHVARTIVDEFNNLHFKDAAISGWGSKDLDKFLSMPYPHTSEKLESLELVNALVRISIEWFSIYDSSVHRSIYQVLIRLIEAACENEKMFKEYTMVIHNYYNASFPITSIDNIYLV